MSPKFSFKSSFISHIISIIFILRYDGNFLKFWPTFIIFLFINIFISARKDMYCRRPKLISKSFEEIRIIFSRNRYDGNYLQFWHLLIIFLFINILTLRS